MFKLIIGIILLGTLSGCVGFVETPGYYPVYRSGHYHNYYGNTHFYGNRGIHH
jgi:hypothetical protein